MSTDSWAIPPLRIAGATVVIETNDERFAQIASWAFVDLVRSDSADSELVEADPITFSVRRNDGPGDTWGVWRDGEPCETMLDPGYVLFHLQWELNRIVLERRSVALHASAIMIDDHAVVLCGSSMSGKTTAAGWLSCTAGRYIADEVVAIDADGRALSYHRPLGLRRNGPLAERLAHLEEASSPLQDYEQLIPVSAFGGRCTDAPERIDLIVFPQHTPGGRTAIRPVPKAAALQTLCSHAPSIVDNGRATFRALADLVARVPTVELDSAELEPVADLLRAAMVTAGAPILQPSMRERDDDRADRVAGCPVPHPATEAAVFDEPLCVAVFDERDGSVHLCSPAASAVWLLCDGRTSAVEIASTVSELFGIEQDLAVRDVDDALVQLSRLGLLVG